MIGLALNRKMFKFSHDLFFYSVYFTVEPLM